jgi:hypothetical protein
MRLIQIKSAGLVKAVCDKTSFSGQIVEATTGVRKKARAKQVNYCKEKTEE